MKKILFNDKYGLTQAVLEGKKTQTRRIIKMPDYDEEYLNTAFDWDLRESVIIDRYAKYKVGEIVAIAECYKDIFSVFDKCRNPQLNISVTNATDTAGWSNKMFVKPELMPHQIRITDVRVERLQDISDNDCLKEGVVVNEPKIKGGINMYYPCEYLRSCAKEVGWGRVFHTHREAFAHLINKVSRKDVWQSNPYVFVYDFELVK